jgi:hypothetical protein
LAPAFLTSSKSPSLNRATEDSSAALRGKVSTTAGLGSSASVKVDVPGMKPAFMEASVRRDFKAVFSEGLNGGVIQIKKWVGLMLGDKFHRRKQSLASVFCIGTS